jgi:release factor glutamine methyltransferase
MTPNAQPRSQPWTILKTLQWTARHFMEKGIDQPRPAAEILLAHLLDCQRIDLYLRYDQPLNQGELGRFRNMIRRRTSREPVAYITGHREFWSLDFEVTRDVLIPRPETERLVETILEGCSTRRPLRALDLGVGSGAISVALASERPHWTIMAVDVSTKALAVAQRNAARNGCADAIGFFAGNWFDPIGVQGKPFDLIVSNPPYISSSALPTLEPEVNQFEPLLALDGGKQGMHCIAHLIHTAPAHLKPGGCLFIEIGHDQGPAAKALGNASGAYADVMIHKDYGQRDRVAQLTKR